MISQTSEYALRACLELARTDADGPVRVDDIAEALDVPRNYLSKILHTLGRSRILESTRGPKGGFQLAVPAADLPLARIVELFEPELLQENGRCILGRLRCSDRHPCAAHERWKGAASRIQAFFRKTTIADLATTANENEAAALARGASKPS